MMKNMIFFGKCRLAVGLLLILLLMVFILPASASDNEVEYKWTFATPWPREIQNNSMQLFCDLVKLYSDGKMEITFYPNGQLGTHNEIFHGVQGGSIDIAILWPYVNIVPGGMLNSTPWSVETLEQHVVAYSQLDGVVCKLLLKVWEEVGCHFLFIGLEGTYGLSNNVRPIKTPDDLKDLKMRVSGALANVLALQNMGAGTGMTVATIPWGDLYNALERGVAEGAWTTYSSLIEERHYEVQKYFTEIPYIPGVSNVVVNKEKWDQLPSDIQEAINKAGQITEIHEYEVRRRAEIENRKYLESIGMEIYKPTPEEVELFREKANMPAIWEKLCKPWLDKHYPGENMTQKVLDELERIRNEY